MDLRFDDLIPGQKSQSSGLSFDDLIPEPFPDRQFAGGPTGRVPGGDGSTTVGEYLGRADESASDIGDGPTVGQFATGLGRTISGTFRGAAAGLAQTVSDINEPARAVKLGPDGTISQDFGPLVSGLPADRLRQSLYEGAGGAAETLEAQAYADRQRIAESRPVGAAGFAYDVTSGLGQMVASVVASRLSGNPAVGLLTLADQVALGEYAERRANGEDPDSAGKEAAIAAGIEAVPEKIFGVFDNIVTPGAFNRLRQIAAEGGSEALTEELSILDEALRQGENVGSGSDILGRIGYAGAVGGAMGGLIGPSGPRSSVDTAGSVSPQHADAASNLEAGARAADNLFGALGVTAQGPAGQGQASLAEVDALTNTGLRAPSTIEQRNFEPIPGPSREQRQAEFEAAQQQVRDRDYPSAREQALQQPLNDRYIQSQIQRTGQPDPRFEPEPAPRNPVIAEAFGRAGLTFDDLIPSKQEAPPGPTPVRPVTETPRLPGGVISEAERSELGALGYSGADIRRMTSDDARRFIDQGIRNDVPGAPKFSLGESNSSQDSATFKRLYANPSELIFREKEQNRVDEIKEMYPGDEYDPIVVVNVNGAREIIDGHNRTAVARERGHNIPLVEVTEKEYDNLKSAGYDDIEISYAALSRAGEDESASSLNRQFPGAKVAEHGEKALNILDAAQQLGIDAAPLNRYAKRPRFSFAGERAQTADIDALEQAKQRSSQGEPNEVLRSELGWFKGNDGKWRFELDDSQATIKARDFDSQYGGFKTGRLGDIIDHPVLFNAYPDAADIRVTIDVNPALKKTSGSYDKDGDTLNVVAPTKGRALSTALHEVQHAIQKREGFAQGGDFQEGDYNRLAGEVEARNVQARQNMTEQRRRETPPFLTQDVSDSDQIVRFRRGDVGQDVETQGTVTPESERFTAAMGQYLGDSSGTFSDVTEGSPKKELASQIEQAFGKKVVILRGDEKAPTWWNGAVLPNDRNTIYVNDASQSPAQAVIGHELMHHLQTDRPDLYRVVRREAMRRARNLDQYNEALDALSKGSDNASLNREEMRDEFLADTLGDAFVDPEFWSGLSKRNPSKFNQIARSILDWFNRIIGRSKDFGTSQFMDDVQGYRDVLANVLNQYAQNPSRDFDWQAAFDVAQEQAPIRFSQRGTGGVSQPLFSGNITGQQQQSSFRVPQASQGNARGGAPGGVPGGGSTWNSEPSTKWDRVVYELQNRFIDLKRTQEAIEKTAGAISDDKNAYLGEELYHGRTMTRTEDFLKQELEPLLENISDSKQPLADFEKYLWARHAPDRNAQIAKINPNMPDGGSGMTNDDAAAYMRSLTRDQRTTLDNLAQQIDAIIKGTLDLLEQEGLETPSVLQAWRSTYSNYVPLFREDVGVDSSALALGQGFQVKGPESKRALGSDKPVKDILANIVMQRERAIVRAEKARVGRMLYDLAKSAPNSDFWKIDSPPKIRHEDPHTGFVTERVDPGYKSRPDVFVTKINGKDVSITFNPRNERAMRIAESMKNLDMTEMDWVVDKMSKFTRYFASVNTQYNPIFGVVNLVRDVQGAALNLTTTPIAGKQAEVLNPISLAQAMRAIYVSSRGGDPQANDWRKLWKQFRMDGGPTGYRELFADSADRNKKLLSQIKKAQRSGLPKAATKAWDATFDWLSDYNLAMENAVRLTAYKTALDNGVSRARAASLAKNLTVNFNRKGKRGRELGAMYAFFNASVQGTARIAETLSGPAGKRIIAGGLGIGVTQALLGALMGDEYDKIPEFVKERNLVIPLFPLGREKNYVTIPMPLGYHVIPNMSRVATETAMSGGEDAGRKIVSVLGTLVDAFNPTGSAGFSYQTIAPTIFDPVAALAENKDFAGREIAQEDFSTLDPTPGHSRVKSTASLISQGLSRLVNTVTGGNEYRPGALSPTPDQIDYIFGQLTGGVGREALKVEQTATALSTGEDLPLYKVPLVGRFLGGTEGVAASSGRFYDVFTELNKLNNEYEGRKEDRDNPGAFRKEHPELLVLDQFKAMKRKIDEIRKRKEALDDNDTLSMEEKRERRKAYDDRLEDMMNRAIELYNEAKDGNER